MKLIKRILSVDYLKYSTKIPFYILESKKKGPTIFIVAGIHGDEVTGIAVAKKISKLLKEKLIRGSVYIFPLLNQHGFNYKSRELKTGEDLNRKFPGKINGSFGEKIAYTIFSEILSKNPDLVLDLHNDCKFSISYLLIDKKPAETKTEIYEKIKTLSKNSGLLKILENPKDPETKTLTYSLLKKNIPALTFELGEDRVINKQNLDIGIQAIWNIFSALKIVKPIKIKNSIKIKNQNKIQNKLKNKFLKEFSEPKASKNGILKFLIKPGDFVKKGEPFAEIHSAKSELKEILYMEREGIALSSYSNSNEISAGKQVMSFGVLG